MQDTSTLAALYSALIQANATILAILGGFLLALAPLRGRLRDTLLPDLKSKNDQLRKAGDRLDEILRDLDIDESGDLYIRYVQGKISLADLANHRDALLRSSTELNAAIDQLKDLLVGTAAAEERVIEQWRVSTDYTVGARALLILAFFGILAPAVLLTLLPSDPAPFLRSYFALAAYACSLFGIIILVAALDPRKTASPTDETPGFKRAWRILYILLVLCLIGMIASHLIPFPPELHGDAVPTPPISVATPFAN